MPQQPHTNDLKVEMLRIFDPRSALGQILLSAMGVICLACLVIGGILGILVGLMF